MFRFYAPTKALFDKAWTLPDVETVAASQQSAPPAAAQSIAVTPDNFNRAEADMYWGTIVKDGGFGKFVHHRDLYPIDAPIVRPNRDTLYSMSVFDFDAGPVTVTLRCRQALHVVRRNQWRTV